MWQYRCFSQLIFRPEDTERSYSNYSALMWKNSSRRMRVRDRMKDEILSNVQPGLPAKGQLPESPSS